MFILLLLLAQERAGAQPGNAPRPEFAVASIRPAGSFGGNPEVRNSNGRSHAKNATLKAIMATAYQVPIFQISGGPAWVDSDPFDIEARADDPATGYMQLRMMMQVLLEQRFRLHLHKETRTSSLFSLSVAKSGALLEGIGKISRSADQTSPDETGVSSSPTDTPPRGSVLLGQGLLVANAASMQVLAKVLTPVLERPVRDATNLTGRFDIHLEWAPELQPSGDLPGLFTALREQLGLELKPGRGPVDYLVIDSAEKPSPN